MATQYLQIKVTRCDIFFYTSEGQFVMVSFGQNSVKWNFIFMVNSTFWSRDENDKRMPQYLRLNVLV